MQSKSRKTVQNNFIALLNFIADPAIIVEGKGQFLAVNDAFTHLTGLKKKELVGTAFLNVSNLPAKSKKILMENLKKRMKDIVVKPYEIGFTDKSGDKRYAEVKAKKICYNGQPADLVLFHDITRRKENARCLKEYSEKMDAFVNEKVDEIKAQEEKFETIFNSSADAITLVDPKGNIIECNEATLRLHGFSSRDELIGKSSFELISLKERQKASKLMASILKNPSIKNVELAFLTKEGKEFPAEASVSPITNSSGKPVGFVAITKNISERKKIEEQLRASEKNFRETLDNMLEGCQIIGYDWRYLYVNDAVAEHGRVTKEALLGKTMMEVYPGIEKTKMFSKLRKCMENRLPMFMENEFVFAAGIKGWFELRVQPVPEGIFILSIDITERKKTEEALKESEEKFRNLSEESPNMIFIYKKGRVIYANKKCEDLMGYTKEEFYAPTFNFFTLIAPESQKKLNSSHKRHAEGQEVAPYEYTLVTKAGKRINAVLTSKLIKYEAENATLGIVTDITEGKRIEETLRKERNLLEAVTENIGAGLATISKDYHILWANKLMKQINGDCEGEKCYSTFNKLIDVCPNCGVKKIFETGVPLDIHEYSNLDDKGNRFWIELIVTPIKDEKGKIIAALELAVNITERKRMQDRLAEYSQKLEKLVSKRTKQLKQTQEKLVKSERLAAIGELAAMVGHDLRNPLTGIKGAAYYLKAKHCSEIGDRGKEMLESIENAINYSNKIVNDLLEYSRELNLELTETTPKAMLKKALASLEIPEKIKIVDATADEPKFKADTEQMCRVFVNLIKNAVDAMPEGGTLTIKSKEAKGMLKITFKDTGTGMTEKTLHTLKRGVPLFTTKAKGMGFGLPICKRIAEAHGGNLSLESKNGKGTKITVTILVHPKPADEIEEKWIFSESMLSKITASHGTQR
jgi:two-component system cell cycle sensor histidine kinase/response regulator CckA